MSNMSLPADLKAVKNLKKKSKTKNRRNHDNGMYRIVDIYGIREETKKIPKNDLLARAEMISKKAKEVYNEVGIMSLSTHNNDQNNVNNHHQYKIPSTPIYSDMSCEHDIVKYPFNVPGREDRILVVILSSMTFFIQMVSRDIWIPLFESSLIAFPKWSQTSLALFTVWNSIMGILFMIPACVFINKFGIRTSILCSCIMSTLGAALRCLPYVEDSTFIIHVSAVFLSGASVVIKPLTVTISTCCFRTGERNLITGIMTSASMMGIVAGLLLTIILRDPATSILTTSAQWRFVVMNIMYSFFAMNFVCTLMVYTSFPRDLSTEVHDKSSTVRRRFVPSKSSMLHIVFNNSSLVYVALAYACSSAYSWPWYQMINVTYSRMGFPQQVGEDCRIWMIIHTCVLTMFVSWLADRFVGSNKCLGLVYQFIASIFLLCVLWILNFQHSRRRYSTLLIVCVLFAFPLSWATQGLLYELAADHAYPLPGNVAVGFIELLRIVSENIVYSFMAVFPNFHLYWMHVFTFIAGLLSFIFLTLLNTTRGNRY